MNVTWILAVISLLVISILVLNWKLKKTGQQLDEAINKVGVKDAVIKNAQTAQQIKNRNADRNADDRDKRMRAKGYLRD
ncbi:hypothetical protein GCM10023338_08680 [Wohlfahrtiimonas larvae]|uniref:DUF2681 domain-containing protein n=1 Tax=Wohlfahrtiimonas larvae TaxID=1157986 RepID=A0ABP9MIY9_9GAMM